MRKAQSPVRELKSGLPIHSTATFEPSPSSEADSSSASAKIPRILKNPKIHYRVHYNTPSNLIASQFNPIHIVDSISPRSTFNTFFPSCLPSDPV
jgi:hypothetical protein